MMGRLVYVLAMDEGGLPSGQRLIKLAANNTDGIRPFYTEPRFLLYPDTDFGKWNVIKYNKDDGWLYNLPQDEQEVLVSWKSGVVTTDVFNYGGRDGCWWDSGIYVEEGQAWMPLPAPYKKG